MKRKHFKKNKKIKNSKAQYVAEENSIDELIVQHTDPDGRVIFINENSTPNWLVLLLKSFLGHDNFKSNKYLGIPL